MTSQHPRDQKQLEQATTRSLPLGTPFDDSTALDDNTAALRDGWLSLGSAVDRANADFSESELLTQVLAVQDVNPRVEPARPATMPQPVEAWRGWPAILAGALALTMLLAVARTLWEASREPIAANSPVTPESLPSSDAYTAGDESGWSDPLDEELDEAAEEVRSLVAQTSGVDASLSSLSEQLESMSDDLTNNSL